jgi:hypothetical protein
MRLWTFTKSYSAKDVKGNVPQRSRGRRRLGFEAPGTFKQKLPM